MSWESDPAERLLADLIREDAAWPRLEAEIARRGLAVLARRRRRRVLRLALPLAAAATLLFFAGSFLERPDQEGADQTRDPMDTIIVRTTALAPDQVFRSDAAVPEILLVQTERGIATVIHTDGDQSVARLDDDQLLACFRGVPVALVETRGGRERLLFFDPSDEARLMARWPAR